MLLRVVLAVDHEAVAPDRDQRHEARIGGATVEHVTASHLVPLELLAIAVAIGDDMDSGCIEYADPSSPMILRQRIDPSDIISNLSSIRSSL